MGAGALPQSIVRQTGSRLASAVMICRSELPEHPDAINRTVSQTSVICGAVMCAFGSADAACSAGGSASAASDVRANVRRQNERTCMQHSKRCCVVELSGLQRP